MPSPPVGKVPVNAAGIVPVQMDCAAATVLFAITGFTVICIAVDVLVHPPDVVTRLYHVVAVKLPGV